MLGQPLSMLMPEVVGFKLTGKLPAGATATDLVLTVTEMLRKKRVVGKFVEFYGAGLSSLSLADRATIANMAPEYGATMGFFPVDDETLKYLRLTGRGEEQVALVEAYTKAQGLFRTDETPDPELHRHARARPRDRRAVASPGPRRPQDRIPLRESKALFGTHLDEVLGEGRSRRRHAPSSRRPRSSARRRSSIPPSSRRASPSRSRTACRSSTTARRSRSRHGAVVIAAITSCTNTSQPERHARRGPARAQRARRRG